LLANVQVRALGSIGVIVISLSGTRTRSVGGIAKVIASSNASHCARDVVTNARFTGYFTPTINDDVGDEAEAEAHAYLLGV
jgi:hypothetical protein